MGKIAVVTDSNSGITQEKGKELGVHVIPMPFYIDGELFLEDITLTQEAFYEKLASDCEISTSQPAPGEAYSDVKWAKQHLRDGDYAVKGL